MMNIKAVYSQMGVVVGDFIHESETEFEINNPVMLVTQRDSAVLVPILALMEETNVTIKKDSVLSGRSFTPVIDIINNYNKLYGSGIVQVTGSFKI